MLPRKVKNSKVGVHSEHDRRYGEKSPYPEWYIATVGDKILGGLGVIENNFHQRRDLIPNVCAVYVEENCRGKGMARALLDFVCKDMNEHGIDKLYLLTHHKNFYERCGWEFYCEALGDGEQIPPLMYIHKA